MMSILTLEWSSQYLPTEIVHENNISPPRFKGVDLAAIEIRFLEVITYHRARALELISRSIRQGILLLCLFLFN